MLVSTSSMTRDGSLKASLRKVFNRRGISSLRCRIGTVFRENVFRRKNRSSKKRPSSTRLYKSVVVVAIIRTSNDNGTELPMGI